MNPSASATAEITETSTYHVVRTIAKGGMGTVCEAVHRGVNGFEKRVAIKQLLPKLSEDETFVSMFIAEAKLVADLVHENIIQIYQFNRDERGYYIVMEYVNGLSLAEFIQRHEDNPLSEELAVFIISRIARGLAHAHSRRDIHGKSLKIVHRDVCPKNTLITTEGLPKLGDFGIATAGKRLLVESESGWPWGKVAYMSPEQARKEEVDHRSDQYSLGLVLFELLAMKRARLPWLRSPLVAASQGWVDWDALPRKTSKRLKKLMRKMLDNDPNKRYESTDELARDLEYHIYRKGYGPTIVTLERYLRDLCPELYEVNRG